MVIEPHILFAKVMHKRLFPKVNAFAYGIYFLAFPLSQALPISRNSPAFLSFHDRDHGPCDGGDLTAWALQILSDFGLKEADGEITLICMPRILGYVFNPVSFWLCHDKQNNLRGVLCEVHNTFGERHTYLCAHTDHRPITKDDWLEGEKLFHVSPFLKREGHYKYRFDVRDDKFGVWIDFYDGENKKQLITSLIGSYETMDKTSLNKAFWGYPLVTFKAIILIHWQALKLIAKGIKYISKPLQKQEKVSATDNLTKV